MRRALLLFHLVAIGPFAAWSDPQDLPLLVHMVEALAPVRRDDHQVLHPDTKFTGKIHARLNGCLLYTSDAADE